MPKRLFVPSIDHPPSSPRVDDAGDIRDVIAVVTVRSSRATTELVIGLDAGRVIRVVATRELPARAKAQLEVHERARPRMTIEADELYVMDVQVVEKQPDAPGADDPLFLYGVLRGPYPDALAGVAGIEGQLATTRGPLLDGLASGIDRSFVYESGRCGTTCTHAALPIDIDPGARSVVLAFPLVAMGDDGSNELIAAQLIHDVLGAMCTDLGDDLATDPVPVPDRASYERELIAAGWTVKGEHAIHAGGKGRFASLFSPGKKQKLPREVALADYIPLITKHLGRLPRWLEPARGELHAQLGFRARQRPPTPAVPPPAPKSRPPASPATPRSRPPTSPPPIPPPRSETPPAPSARPPTSPPPVPPPQRRRSPTNPSAPPPPKARRGPRTVAAGLTAQKPKEWIKQLIDDHSEPDRARPRATAPDRSTVTDWMRALIDTEFPDE